MTGWPFLLLAYVLLIALILFAIRKPGDLT